MDPHYWHLQSMIINHDHPYSRPSYLDPISTLCIEPAFGSNDSELGGEGASYMWVDVEGDETRLCGQVPELPVNEDSCQFSRFCAYGPVDEPKFDNKQSSHSSTFHVTWNTTVDKLYRKIEKALTRIDFDDSVSSQMRIDTCAELHELLLNTLPSSLLLLYLRGYACLMHQSRTSPLLRRLNSEIILQRTVKRFDYSKYIDRAFLPSTDGFGSPLCRATHSRLHDGSASSYSPITCIPTDSLITGSLSTSTSTPGRVSSIMDEPVFVCVIAKGYTKSSRIGRMLKSLSQLGRLMVISMNGTTSVQIRRLIRHFVSLTEDPRPIPIYLVGFGKHCDIVLTAAVTSPYLLPPSNGGALEEIICGRLTSSDAPIPTRPWLAGLVLIAPPKGTYRLGNLSAGLDNIARRCSLLLVISSKHEVDGNAFREALIAARRRSTAASVHGGVSGLRGMDWKAPCEFDLRMLVIGGADHLLRMHPATLRRFATTQAAIDLAIIAAVKNLVAVCRTLVNSSAAPVSTHGTGVLESAGSRSITGLPVSWLPSATNVQPDNRKVSESNAFARKASILRGSMHTRCCADRYPTPQLYASRQKPSLSLRDRLSYSAGFGAGPVIRYGDGARNRTLCRRQSQLHHPVHVFSDTQTPRFGGGGGGDMTDSPHLRPASHPPHPMNHDAQSGSRGEGRVRGTRFYNRN
ncbi:unnamed protein product [Hydatigera taeniaeformis]|uniref:DAGKc domain-containing protein n=1 Tax=Hydatigena taeniaeformis TaxID=6205 RepID=A0A0R3X6X1_HYDTA|nr:unnamed protein product [Hydatigera taeniaeformis]